MNEPTTPLSNPNYSQSLPVGPKEIQQLSREVASARQKIGKGEAVDLSGLPERMRDLFSQTLTTDKSALENAVVALMAECDGLVGEIETMQAQLGRDIRQDQQHRNATSAYRPKSTD